MRKLKHPLRYYLTMQWVDVGGHKVLYTPANETTFQLIDLFGNPILTIRVIGSYAIHGKLPDGLELVEVDSKYVGEVAVGAHPH